MANIKNKELNLYRSLKSKGTKKVKEKKAFGLRDIFIIAAIGYLGVLGVMFGTAQLDLMNTQMDYDDLEEQLTNPEFVAKYEAAQTFGITADAYDRQLNALNAQLPILNVTTNQLSFFSYELFSTIMGTLDKTITMESYSLSTAGFSGSFTAKTADDVSEFVDRLRATSLFGTILFTGYEESGESGFSFSLDCGFKSGEVTA